MSCAPKDMHKSKLVIIILHFAYFGKTYSCFVFFTKLEITPFEKKKFLKERPLENINAS
jgi:hypothetical protein